MLGAKDSALTECSVAQAQGVTKPNFERGRANLVKRFRPIIPHMSEKCDHNSSNMMKTIPIILLHFLLSKVQNLKF